MSAKERLDALTDALHRAGHTIISIIREFAVYDSNVQLDEGWIDRGEARGPPPGQLDGSAQAESGPRRMPPDHHPAPATDPANGVDTGAGATISQDPVFDVATREAPARSAAAIGALVSQVLWTPIHPCRQACPARLLHELVAEVGAGACHVDWLEGTDAPPGTRTGIFHYRDRVSAWSPALLVARGLVVREHRPSGRAEVLATPFCKFFKLGEDGLDVDQLLPRCARWEITEKMDGSMGILFFHACAMDSSPPAQGIGSWRIVTKRSFNSVQGLWATAWLHDNCNMRALPRGVTFVTEIVCRQNWVCVRYPAHREGVIVCAAFDAEGRELERAALEQTARECGLPLVPLLASGRGGSDSSTLRQAVANLMVAPGRLTEGGVLRLVFPDGASHRVKVHSREYKAIFRDQDAITPKAVWALAKASGTAGLLRLRAKCPDEFVAFLADLEGALLTAVVARTAEVNEAVSFLAAAGCTGDKAVAEWLAARPHPALWDNGKPISAVQRSLVHRALAGTFSLPPEAERLDVQARGRLLLDHMDLATRNRLFAHVAVPAMPADCLVYTADGMRLWNHRR